MLFGVNFGTSVNEKLFFWFLDLKNMVIKETILEMIVTVKSLGLFLLIPSMYICIFMYILADFFL